MSEQYKVSIITVSYNSIKTIEETIHSVLGQTYPEIEHIIIDGGSTDGTVNIIKKYNSEIAYWISERDDGISDAFNKGLLVATGDIIGILNADDLYTPDTVSIAVETLKKYAEIDFVFGNMCHADENGNIIYQITGDCEYIKKIKYTMPAILHPTVFMRSSVYNNHGGFNISFKTAMDYEFLLRITIGNAKGKYIPQVLAIMRLGGESSTNIIRGCREVMMASTHYGYNKYLAYSRFLMMSSKVYVRKALEGVGLDKLIKLYRSYVDRRYIYRK